MTQENKNLLLKDLCARLPYGVKVKTPYDSNATVIGVVKRKSFIRGGESIDILTNKDNYPIKHIKPYLFPLSSMTEEQREEYHSFFVHSQRDFITPNNAVKLFDWLFKNHFDYRGLIEKGLAIDCTNLNIY